MGDTLITIQQGDPVIVEAEVEFLGVGAAGDPGACRRLVFPTSVSPLLAPVVYQYGDGICANPSRTFNLDNDVLRHPITTAVLTLSSTRVVRFEQQLEDVIVSELWEGSDTQVAMTTALFRKLYEYLHNGALLAPQDGEYIIWEPRDRTTKVYNVELLSLTVGGGGGSGERRFDVQDLREPGGLANGGTIENALDGLELLPSGWVDRDVELRMRIVSEA